MADWRERIRLIIFEAETPAGKLFDVALLVAIVLSVTAVMLESVATVGYGDLAPITPLGKVLASLVMILGYGIIAVPTGIVTAEIVDVAMRPPNTRSCPSCLSEGHHPRAHFCRDCGAALR